jgi:hypothetical protein
MTLPSQINAPEASSEVAESVTFPPHTSSVIRTADDRQRQNEHDRQWAEPAPAPTHVNRIRSQQDDQQRDLDARDKPVRAQRLPLGLDHAQHNRDGDEGAERQRDRPARLDDDLLVSLSRRGLLRLLRAGPGHEPMLIAVVSIGKDTMLSPIAADSHRMTPGSRLRCTRPKAVQAPERALRFKVTSTTTGGRDDGES